MRVTKTKLETINGYILLKEEEPEMVNERRNIILIGVISVFLYIVTSYVSTALHEAGHQIFNVVAGGKWGIIYLRLFGWSRAYSIGVPDNISFVNKFMIDFGGIFVQTIVAVAVFALFYRYTKTFFLRLLIIQFTFGSIIQSLSYLGSDAILMNGDGGNIVRLTGIPGYAITISSILVGVSFLPFLIKTLFNFAGDYFSLNSFSRKFSAGFFVLGLPIIIQANISSLNQPEIPKWIFLITDVTAPIICSAGAFIKRNKNIDHSPSHTISQKNLSAALLLFAMCMAVSLFYFGANEIEFVIRKITIAINHNPDDPLFYRERSRQYWRTGDNENAIKDLDKVIKIDPKNVDALVARSNYYIDKGDPSRAIKDLLDLIMKHHDLSSISDISFSLAIAYSIIGDKKEGLTWLEKAADKGYQNFEYATNNKNFNIIRNEPDFNRILKKIKSNREEHK